MIPQKIKTFVYFLNKHFQEKKFQKDFGASNSHWVKDIKSTCSTEELRALFYLAQQSDPNYPIVEIGSFLGASSCYLAAGLPQGSRIICIDTWGNETMPDGSRDTFSDFTRNIKPFAKVITCIRKRSNEIEPQELPSRLSLAFIDGDHSYDQCRQDLTLVADSIIPNGILVAHDFSLSHPGVCQALSEFVSEGSWSQLLQQGSLIALKKMPS